MCVHGGAGECVYVCVHFEVCQCKCVCALSLSVSRVCFELFILFALYMQPGEGSPEP